MASSTAEDVQVALQRAKRKIAHLQQQLSDRQTRCCSPLDTSLSIWTPSRELRDSLVDMYTANPRVNEELRQRLPSSAALQLRTSTEQLSNSPRSGVSLDITAWPPAPEHSPLISPSPLSFRRPISPSSPLSLRRPVSPSSPLSLRRSVSPSSPLSLRRSVSPSSPLSLRRPVSPSSPLRRPVSPSSPLRRPVSPSSPLSLRRPVSPVSAFSSRPPGGAGEAPGEMETDYPSRDSSPQAENSGVAPAGGAAAGRPAGRTGLVHSDTRCPQDVSGGPAAAHTVQSLDRDKNISFLLKQLDAVRDINQKLQDQLVLKEKELQRREVDEELREEQREALTWERPTAVLEELLAAQRDRDQALMSRLLLANEERDEAELRARQQQKESEHVELLDSDQSSIDQDIEDLLQKVCDADSLQELDQFGSALVHRLRLAKQRKHDITAEEMKAVMEERDGSLRKCKQLEQDLVQERERWASKRERGGAPEGKCPQEAGLGVSRANHSSQDLFTPPSLPVEGAPVVGVAAQTPPPQATPLLVQVQQLSKEKQNMEAELQRCQEAEREASERVRRLERLVDVLRKKVGTGNVRAVI
ncbi:uncharacterized protein V6R79_025667 [Siganus canaliculatus]